MKTNLKLKIVKREGVVETNSSSSHSVVIQTAGTLCKAGDPCWDLDIRDNILYVPNRNNGFGWEEFKSNSCLVKLQYVCGLMCNEVFTAEGHKRIFKLTEALKSFLGVDDVKYEWIEENKDKFDFSKHIDPEDLWIDCIEVDHNSTDLIDEIYENEFTLSNFIFNPNSWLYGGNDNSNRSHNFRRETIIDVDDDTPDCYISVMTDNVGRVDIILSQANRGFRAGLLYYSEDKLITMLSWDKEKNSIFLNCNQENTFENKNIIPINSTCPVVIKDGNAYLLFGAIDVNKEMYKSQSISDIEKSIREEIKNGLLKDGVDYRVVPVEIKLIELEDGAKNI